MIDRTTVQRAFADYVSAYHTDDPKVRLKIAHTYRVAALCERIGADVRVPDVELV